MKNLLTILAFLPLILAAQTVGINNNSLTVNGTDSTNVTGNLHITGYVLPSRSLHAFCYFPESSITFEFDVTATWYHLTNATNNLFATCECDGFTVTTDTMEVTGCTGDYLLTAKLNFSGTVNQTYKLRFFNVTKNTGIPIGSARDGSGTDIVAITVTAYGEDLEIGDKIILQFQNADGSADATLASGSIFIQFVHD